MKEKNILPLQSSIILCCLLIGCCFSSYYPDFSIFIAIYALSLLIMGNQWRVNFFADHPIPRKLNLVIPMAAASLFYIGAMQSDIFNFNMAIFYGSCFLGVVFLCYQVYRHLAYIKTPELVFFTLSAENQKRSTAIMNLSLALLSAVAEELLFRGVIYTAIPDSFIAYAGASAIFFLAYHFSTPWGEKKISKEDMAIQIFSAIIFCSITFYFKSLIPSIVAHVLFNLGANIRSLIIIFKIAKEEDDE